MAADEAVFLQSRGRTSPPTLRFYAWRTPAVSIGYFQQVDKDIDLAACRQRSVGIVRRPTGGKAVFHDIDLTYSVVGCERRDGFPSDILGTYRMISRCLVRGLNEMGVDARMAQDGRQWPARSAAASCFSMPSRYELLVGGRKICGSAQVRSHGAFLQHGSLLLDFDPLSTAEILLPHHQDRDQQVGLLCGSVTSLAEHGVPFADIGALCRIMQDGFEAELGIGLEAGALTPDEEALKGRLLRDKYTNDRWNLGYVTE
jgi:lipoate-protein ligase A